VIPLVKKNAGCVMAARAAAKQTDDQHKLIARYRDIAAKLCDPPLNCDRPEQWHGYIPPAYDGERENGTTPLNASPVRVQLMALLEEAAVRADAEMGRAA
jgi:hypothetical protein